MPRAHDPPTKAICVGGAVLFFILGMVPVSVSGHPLAVPLWLCLWMVAFGYVLAFGERGAWDQRRVDWATAMKRRKDKEEAARLEAARREAATPKPLPAEERERLAVEKLNRRLALARMIEDEDERDLAEAEARREYREEVKAIRRDALKGGFL